jgi:hypothetical protein
MENKNKIEEKIKIFLIINPKNGKIAKSFLKRLDAETWLHKYRNERSKYGIKYKLIKKIVKIEI